MAQGQSDLLQVEGPECGQSRGQGRRETDSRLRQTETKDRDRDMGNREIKPEIAFSAHCCAAGGGTYLPGVVCVTVFNRSLQAALGCAGSSAGTECGSRCWAGRFWVDLSCLPAFKPVSRASMGD